MKVNIKPLKYSLTAVLTIGLFTACEPEIERDFPDADQTSGEADFSTYVALGNSLTAGVIDNRLNRFGQLNSYPAIIADKMASVVPDFTFRQPLLPEGLADGTLQLSNIIPGTPPTPVIIPSEGGLSSEEIANDMVTGPVHNLGIPGAKAGDLTDPGFSNTYFQRLVSPGNLSVVDKAVELNPTFFTLWIGNNDILGYATDGGRYFNEDGELVGQAITPVEEFEAAYSEIISKLQAKNPSIEGALGNIPNVANIAYFNVVPWDAFALTSDEAAMINASLKAAIEESVRDAVILGVITEGARREIIAVVAQQVVRQQTYESAKAAGATDEQAEQQADTYIQTEEGMAVIQGLVENLTNNRLPAEVHAIVENELVSETIQTQIATAFEAAKAADEDPERDIAEVLGEEGAAAVEWNFTTQIALLKAAKYYPVVAEGPNGFIVESETSPTGFIQLTESGKMLLPFLGRTEEEFNPEAQDIFVPDYYALDQEEAAQVNVAVTPTIIL